MKKISVITINFNNNIGLKKTIRSVISQPLFNNHIEYIIIDGGSNDGSVETIQEFEDSIRYWVSEKDQGIYHAQNKGIVRAGGKYCLFLNSGDFLCDNFVLQKVVDQKLDKDIVYGNMKINWGNNSVTDGYMPEYIDLRHMLKDTLWHPVSFIRRALFDTYGKYDLAYKLVADYDFFFKVLIANHCNSKHISVFVSEFNTEGLSSDPKRKTFENEERKRVISSYLSPEETKKALKYLKRTKSPFMRLVTYLKHKLN
jgi:glycosyltransferase involved in cell wall biosynthesis